MLTPSEVNADIVFHFPSSYFIIFPTSTFTQTIRAGEMRVKNQHSS
jgi:hypothetical protein